MFRSAETHWDGVTLLCTNTGHCVDHLQYGSPRGHFNSVLSQKASPPLISRGAFMNQWFPQEKDPHQFNLVLTWIPHTKRQQTGSGFFFFSSWWGLISSGLHRRRCCCFNPNQVSLKVIETCWAPPSCVYLSPLWDVKGEALIKGRISRPPPPGLFLEPLQESDDDRRSRMTARGPQSWKLRYGCSFVLHTSRKGN